MGFVSSVVGGATGAVGGIIGKAHQNTSNAFAAQSGFQAKLPEDVVAQQKWLADKLAEQVSGKGPNPAQQQFQNNMSAVGAQQAGAIASQKGINPGLAARLIANQGAQSQMQGAGAAAALQAQQQLDAQGLLQSQQAQQVGQALSAQGIDAGIEKTNLENRQAASKQLFGAAASAMMASDENLKENVRDFDSRSFLKAIDPHRYQYKDEKFGGGEQIGVMAQDLEKKAPQLVVDTPEGKAIDYNKSGGILLASLADMNDRLSKIESKWGGGTVGNQLKGGGKVPGKAKVSGDSPKNDTVHAMLSPGEIVIPRTLADDPERAKKFIEQLKGKKEEGGYKKVISAKRKK